MTRLGWEKFARARAQLDAGLAREAVLAEADVDGDTWRREEENLLGVLADDVERADFARIEAYRRAYQTTWMELTHLAVVEPPERESEGRRSPLPSYADLSPPVQDAMPVTAWTPSLPDDHGGLDQTLTTPGLLVRAANPLPFTSGGTALPSAPAVVPLQKPVIQSDDFGGLDQTMTVVSRSARAENPLPFTAGAPATPTAPVKVPLQDPVISSNDYGGLDQTMAIVGVTARAEKPLPFTAVAPAMPTAPAAPLLEPATSGSADYGTETMWAPLGFTVRSPLPFQSTIDSAPPSEPPTPRRGAVTAAELPPSQSAQVAASGSTPDLTLEQYASLCAELAVFPQHVDAIFQRYGLGPLKTRLTVDLAWRERLRRDAAEHQAWQRLYQRYHAYWADPTRRDGPP